MRRGRGDSSIKANMSKISVMLIEILLNPYPEPSLFIRVFEVKCNLIMNRIYSLKY